MIDAFANPLAITFIRSVKFGTSTHIVVTAAATVTRAAVFASELCRKASIFFSSALKSMKNKNGKIVSRRASRASKRTFVKNGLSAYAYRSSTSPSSYTPDWLANL